MKGEILLAIFCLCKKHWLQVLFPLAFDGYSKCFVCHIVTSFMLTDCLCNANEGEEEEEEYKDENDKREDKYLIK